MMICLDRKNQFDLKYFAEKAMKVCCLYLIGSFANHRDCFYYGSFFLLWNTNYLITLINNSSILIYMNYTN